MPLKTEFDELYLGHAFKIAQLSKGIRLKVGAVLVTKNGVCLPGYNGTAVGDSNSLERIDTETGELITKTEVIHAELNCIMKAAREGVSTLGSTIYITHAPCLHCAAMLVNAGVSEVCFSLHYKSEDGLKLCHKLGIVLRQVPYERIVNV